MKDVIDVLELQREKNKKITTIQYLERNDHFFAARFIFECGIKLGMQPLTTSTAAHLYHKFFKEADLSSYDVYLIAATCLYLAGKIKDDPVKIRDVINVSNKTLHRNSPPLELNEDYWHRRDAIVQAELLIIRMLKFEVNPTFPHKYAYHYLRTLQGWMTSEEWKQAPIAKASTAFLQDVHHSPAALEYKPQHLAIAAINLALQVYGVSIPVTDDSDTNQWYSAFVTDLSKDKLWEIMEKMMDTYDKDVQIYDME